MRGGKPQQLCEGCWELLCFCLGQERRKVVASGSTGPCFDGEDHEPAPPGTEEVLGMCAPWICVHPGALLLRIAGASSGWLEEVKGDTRVVSTSSCAPPHNGSPLAITSILLSSCRLMWSQVEIAEAVLVVTLAPASGKLWLLPFPKGIPRPRKPGLGTCCAMVA